MDQILREVPKYTRDAIVIARLNPGEGDRTEIVWVNQAFSELTGYTSEEMIGKSPRILQGPDTDREVIADIRTKVAARQPIRAEILNYRKDGTTYWVEVNITSIENDGLGGIHFVSVQRDMTERHAMEDDLLRAKEVAEAASQAKSSFLGMMSHELRTPLNSILGFVQLMQMEPGIGERHGEFLSNIRSSSGLLLRVIDDILDIAKLESEQVKFEEDEFSLSKELESAAAAWSTRAVAKGLDLTVENNVDHDGFVADKSRIRQVLNNVVLNAIKYTLEGGVTIRLGERRGEDAQSYLDIEVQDTGIGIERHRLEQIFQPFSRGDSDVVRAEEGVGLGLSICLRIISGMGGSISVESVSGKGSTFSLSLPVKTAESMKRDVSEASISEQPVPHEGATRLLVVEDNPMNQKVMASLLTALGYEFDIVGNGKEAVQAVSGTTYDTVLMDISMPVMSGDMATRVIRAMDAPLCDVPIVAVTAHAMKGDQERLMSAGFSDYLPKPIDVAGLATMIAKYVSARQAVA